MTAALRRREVLGGLAGALVLPPLASSGLLHAQEALPLVTTPFKVVSRATIALTINVVGGTLVNIGYTTPTGNNPAAFGNTLHLWSTSAGTVPWNRPPEASAAVIGSAERSDQNLLDISITDDAYLIGYAVGPVRAAPAWSPYCGVVASAFIPPGTGGSDGASYAYASPKLDLDFVGSASLVYRFAFLSGFRARSSGAWVGLWTGSTASYTVPPDWFDAIRLDSEAGVSGLNGIRIVRGGTYALGLFAEGYDADPAKLGLTRLAAALTFSV